MRNEPNVNPIPIEEITSVSSYIGANSYKECSALTRQGLKQVFDEAIIVGLGGTKKTVRKPKSKCSLI